MSSEGTGKTIVPLPTEVNKNKISIYIQKLQDIPRTKTTITPVIPVNTGFHLVLYKQRALPEVQVPQVQQTLRLRAPRKHKKRWIRNKKLDKLIKE